MINVLCLKSNYIFSDSVFGVFLQQNLNFPKNNFTLKTSEKKGNTKCGN